MPKKFLLQICAGVNILLLDGFENVTRLSTGTPYKQISKCISIIPYTYKIWLKPINMEIY